MPAAAANAHANNLDALRLLAAVAVIFSHAFPLAYGAGTPEPLSVFSLGQTTLGTLAVYVFFVLSGYLITGSFARQGAAGFVLARALRLLPGLAVVLVVLAFVVGPLLTTLPLADYFRSYDTYEFVAKNLSLLGYAGRLPGVFDAAPLPHAVDGSLWTLSYEARCYALVLMLGICGALNRWAITAIWAGSLGCVAMGIGSYTAELGAVFLGGSALYAWRPPLRPWLAGVCAILWAASLRWGGFPIGSATAGAYVILYVGLSPTVHLPRPRNDVSYGTYIWAFPVQPGVSLALGQLASWWSDALLSLPFILALAWVSCRFIEQPALALRRRWRR